MKDILKKIFTKIQSTGIAIVDTNFLKDNSWFYVTNEMLIVKTVYIFRGNGELLISKKGNITKANWENLVHSTNSLIIEISKKATLYNIIFLTSDYLILQKDGTEIIDVFIKQEKYDSKVPKSISDNSISYILSDLKLLLNEKNKRKISLEEIDEIHLNRRELRPANETTDYNDNNFLISTTNNRNDKFEYYDILEILEEKIRRGEIRNKEEETFHIIEMQNKEEELIEFGEICGKCKAIGSLKDGICLACNK